MNNITLSLSLLAGIFLATSSSVEARTKGCFERNPSFSLQMSTPGTACKVTHTAHQAQIFYLGNTIYGNSNSNDVQITCPVPSGVGNFVKVFISNTADTNANGDGRVKCTLITGTGRHPVDNETQVHYRLFEEKTTSPGGGTKSLAWYGSMDLFSTIQCILPPPSKSPNYDPPGIAGIIKGGYDGTTIRCPDGILGEPVTTSSLPWDAVPGVTYPPILLD